MAENEKASRVSVPTITLPPRSSPEAIFSGDGASPGPMTLVSNFFSEVYPDSDCRSFSQLLAGAMASPVAAAAAARPCFGIERGEGDVKEPGDGSEPSPGFKQSRPVSLVVARSPMFTVPPGLSPSGFLNSPGFFSPGQSPFGMSHQQALAQVTAQAVISQSHMHLHAEYQSSSLPPLSETLIRQPSFTPDESIPPMISEPKTSTLEISEVTHSDRKSQPPAHVDKPVDDGYNWRKYGQKQVKGSEYPRSYYKCTHLNCPVKKKVERSLEGQITEIIYKGQHNHELPQPGKRAKDSGDQNGNMNTQAKSEVSSQGHTRNLGRLNNVSETAQESKQAVLLQSPELNVSEEAGDTESRAGEVDDDEPNPKKRNKGAVASESASTSHKTVTEPRIIVQTRSEVDLLDDGYRWRKYGQKVVKGNPHPRSYYKCTSVGCNVRKHVERASTDPKAVITTYEGKHNHDLPAARNSAYNNNNNLQPKPQKVGSEKKVSLKEMKMETKDERPVALVHLKEEQQITV